ncbi:hypothetical protein M758_UG276300 [Ceratodon purpureus]|nr:hypothetical protein M758_UG276300 [Ceratodon purpureus]
MIAVLLLLGECYSFGFNIEYSRERQERYVLELPLPWPSELTLDSSFSISIVMINFVACSSPSCC